MPQNCPSKGWEGGAKKSESPSRPSRWKLVVGPGDVLGKCPPQLQLQAEVREGRWHED